jgi:RNA polymerase sigma-70 factor (ECF subfamily)
MQTNNDLELIARTLDGDDDAFAVLIDRYKDAVYYHCFAIVRDEDVAEDMAQETFITAYYKLQRYNPEFRLATWLFKISTNKCLTHLKRKSTAAVSGDDLLEHIVDQRANPHKQAIDSELHDAVSHLKPKFRAVISLYYWQGLQYEEVATAMGAPKNSVRVWLKRAKEELRKELS